MENKVSCQIGLGKERELASLSISFSQVEGTVKAKKEIYVRRKK